MTIVHFVAVSILFTLATSRDAGLLYEVWHTTASHLMKEVQDRGGLLLTTEKVIRSNGEYSLDDVYKKYGLSGDIWNVQPQLGFYCLYRKRPNDTNPPTSDCLNIPQTAKAHAELINDAGFDYITIDITNWPVVNTGTDVAVLRPTEVLFEEWLNLRKSGFPTPLISLWPCSPKGSTSWQYLLNTLYNDPQYEDLIYKMDGKKVVFLPDNPSCYDVNVEQEIRKNGGRNDVTTIKMWALFGHSAYNQGAWGFFSPCTASSNPEVYTTSMVGEGPCNQFNTIDSKGILWDISASGSYMLSQTALPFASPGKLRGLTIHRLFQNILSYSPPHIFVSSFNEHIGGRQNPASSAKIAFNMGLPNDSQRFSVWVDTYGSEFSRDIEPSVEGGNRVYQVASSCVKMYKNHKTCDDSPEEACCTTDDKEIFGNIWSLEAPDGTDYLITPNVKERNELVEKGWIEHCSAIIGPSVFCVNSQEPDGRSGPFMLYNISLPGTIPLFRCIFPDNVKHFISIDSKCEGQRVEATVGYIALKRGGEMLRALRRCKGEQKGTFLHALDLECLNPDTEVLGYVR